MIATGLSAPTQSGVGIAAATVSPMISYEIGQKIKELAKDNADGKLTEKQQAAHVLAHAVLGAAVAAAGGAEAVAPKVSEFLYGTADPEKLTAEQKDTVANIMSLAGAGVGAAVGNTSANAVSGSLNAESAVENNANTNEMGGLMGYSVDARINSSQDITKFKEAFANCGQRVGTEVCRQITASKKFKELSQPEQILVLTGKLAFDIVNGVVIEPFLRATDTVNASANVLIGRGYFDTNLSEMSDQVKNGVRTPELIGQVGRETMANMLFVATPAKQIPPSVIKGGQASVGWVLAPTASMWQCLSEHDCHRLKCAHAKRRRHCCSDCIASVVLRHWARI